MFMDTCNYTHLDISSRINKLLRQVVSLELQGLAVFPHFAQNRTDVGDVRVFVAVHPRLHTLQKQKKTIKIVSKAENIEIKIRRTVPVS